MRVLYFSPRACWPLNSGARLRDYYLAREIARHAEVAYLGFSEPGEIWRGKVGFDSELDCTFVPRPAGFSLPNLIKGLAGPFPVTVLNFTTTAMRNELERMLHSSRFDVVQFEGVHLSAYLPAIHSAPGKPRVFCDWHNIESEILRRYCAKTPLWHPKHWYAAHAAGRLEALEARLLASCDAHFVCSERERRILSARYPAAPIRVLENGVDTNRSGQIAAAHGQRRRDVVFVGAMNYHANIDAVLYFLREIWPLVRRDRGDLRFVVVGSRPTPEILALGSQAGVTVTGTVDDLDPYYEAARVVVVPLRVGSGTRLKVLEAMVAGVPVVSTALGVEGLAVRSGEHLIVAETPAEFASSVVDLAGDDRMCERLARAGRELAVRQYGWDRIGASLLSYYDEFAPRTS